MVNAFHLQAAALRTATFMEFVPSLANIADLPMDLRDCRAATSSSCSLHTSHA